MFCPNCGTQNPDTAPDVLEVQLPPEGSCRAEVQGHDADDESAGRIPARRRRLRRRRPGPGRARAGCASSGGCRRARAGRAPPSKLKGTMVGVAPPDGRAALRRRGFRRRAADGWRADGASACRPPLRRWAATARAVRGRTHAVASATGARRFRCRRMPPAPGPAADAAAFSPPIPQAGSTRSGGPSRRTPARSGPPSVRRKGRAYGPPARRSAGAGPHGLDPPPRRAVPRDTGPAAGRPATASRRRRPTARSRRRAGTARRNRSVRGTPQQQGYGPMPYGQPQGYGAADGPTAAGHGAVWLRTGQQGCRSGVGTLQSAGVGRGPTRRNALMTWLLPLAVMVGGIMLERDPRALYSPSLASLALLFILGGVGCGAHSWPSRWRTSSSR